MDAKGLSPEREAEIRARLVDVLRDYLSLHEKDCADLLSALDHARAELARARKTTEDVAFASTLHRERANRAEAEAAAAHERAIRMAAYKAKAHAHHALWGDFLDYQWDEKIEKFAMALCWRVHDSILSLISEPSNAE